MRKPTEADLRLAPDTVQQYVADLERAVKALGKECLKAKFAFATHVEVCSLAMNVNWAHVVAYNMAREETDKNPIASAAVKEAVR